MKNQLFTVISLALLTGSNVSRGDNQMLFMGSIQFPQTLEALPELRIFCKGHKIKCEKTNGSKKLSFALQDLRRRSSFYLVVTNTINYAIREHNTVAHLTIDPKKPYKLYHLQFVQGFDQDAPYRWLVEEQRLPLKNGRIPDDAIIICYDPNFVESVGGGNAIELPTIHIKSNIVDLLGSEKKLHDKSIELLLASIDHNALHSDIHQELRPDYQQKTILAVTI